MVSIILATVALAAILTLAPRLQPDPWIRFGLFSLANLWIVGITLAALYPFRTAVARMRLGFRYTVVLLLLLGSTCFVVSTGRLLDGGSEAAIWSPGQLLAACGIAAVTGLTGIILLEHYTRARDLAVRVQQAELEALQARVHPHFLFNTLNSAAALVHAHPHDAERVLLDLADLFRAALATPDWVRLEDEIDLCRRYLAIEQMRFGERLRVDWDLGPDLHSCFVPLLLIQPLVENAVAHGIDGITEKKTMRIRIRMLSGELEVSIQNPAPQDSVRVPAGHRIGLAALQARLDLVTRGAGQLRIERENGMFHSRLTVPTAAMPSSPQATTS